MKKPLLLGLSGGPDSMALLHCLEQVAIPFHVAHIDHGFRLESSQEAKLLRQRVEKMGLPFHLKTLRDHPKTNLEDFGRKERLNFFTHLMARYNFQALLLGHHGDDQAETVLKRVLEGAAMKNLAGMREESCFGQVPIWRPFLFHTKREILCYLKKNAIPYFLDPSNQGGGNLRAKMRTDILPHLEEQFGKCCSHNLQRLGSSIQELSDYMDRKIPFKPVRGVLGIFVDFSIHYPLDRFEVAYYLSSYPLSRRQRETIAELLSEKKSNKWVNGGDEIYRVDQGHLFIYPKDLQITWTIEYHEGQCRPSHWRDVWLGEARLPVARKNLILSLPDLRRRGPEKKVLKKWYSENRVPCFLRSTVPILHSGNLFEGEFLTGKGGAIEGREFVTLRPLLGYGNCVDDPGKAKAGLSKSNL